MPTIPGCNISFDKVAARRASPSSSRALVSDGRVRSRIDAEARTQVAREIRCKYAADASGGPADSASLKAAELVLQEFLPTLKALPNAEVTRIMCGGCHDFKIVVNQPCADHDAWKEKAFAPEADIVAKLKAIDGVSAVETQEYTCQPL